MGKSILTMSAAQRLKAQERQSKRLDRAVNKKFKAMKKAWKKKIAGKVLKGAAFVATAAATGAVIGKVKEVVKTKSGDELREMASKIKVRFDEKKAAVKRRAQKAAAGSVQEDMAKEGEQGTEKEVAATGAAPCPASEGVVGAATAEQAAQEINQSME